MLSPNLVNALDMAAANGILDYDGAAFLMGTQPRYMGSPQFALPPSTNLQQPTKDQLIYNNKPKQTSSNPLWKKLLFGALVVGVGIFGISKLKKLPSIKNLFSNITDKVKNFDTTKIKNGWNSICQFFKDGYNKLFGKKTAPTP